MKINHRKKSRQRKVLVNKFVCMCRTKRAIVTGGKMKNEKFKNDKEIKQIVKKEPK